MKEKFTRKPLDLSTFPAQLQMNLNPAAPPPLKMMAARGLAPAPPGFVVRVLYQLQFDADKMVAGEALKSLMDMPAPVLVPQLQMEQPSSVLDWIAQERAKDAAVVEAIILNQHTDDLTIAMIAGEADTRQCEAIANNQQRILRSPVILEELYKNANARMATIDKLLDLARRNNVVLKGLPGVQNALESKDDLGLGQSDEGVDELLLQMAQEDETAEEVDPYEGMTRAERERAEREEEEKLPEGPIHTQISKMNISQKIRLATVGNREAVMLLVREGNRLIHMAAIQSPRLQYSDIKKLAANKSVPDGVIRYIANNREWTKHYDIMVSLVNNPKTPLPDSMSFLNHLRTNDLRMLMRNRGVSHQISRQAKTLVTKRGQS